MPISIAKIQNRLALLDGFERILRTLDILRMDEIEEAPAFDFARGITQSGFPRGIGCLEQSGIVEYTQKVGRYLPGQAVSVLRFGIPLVAHPAQPIKLHLHGHKSRDSVSGC